MKRNLIACSLATALAATAGCYADDTVAAGPSYGYVSSNPSLEVVAPGVQVVDDLDYPVFYANNAYWMYDDGYWYTSPYWWGGWAGIDFVGVPFAVRGIHNPFAFSHFHHGFHSHFVGVNHFHAGVHPHFVAHGGAHFHGGGGFHGGGHGGGHGGHH